MTENYEHYISRNIKAFYKKRLFSPIIYLILLGILWFVFPLYNIISPPTPDPAISLESAHESGTRYITTTFYDLTFTGYTSKAFSSINGYYYYGLWHGECVIVQLAPQSCEQGLPFIESITTHGKIVKSNASYEELLSNLAHDLDWTADGITSQISEYYFSEPDYNPISNIILFIIYFGTMIYAVFNLICCILYIYFPVLSPACQNLIVFGHPKDMLEEAEEELATLPQLATEDMFITEHYFIMTSPYGNAIVPIKEILWIYKHSTLHKFLWYHFSISYTMHITANKHLHIQCPKNMKSDIDGIMDYLEEANHNILVGFSEENRLKVQEVLGNPFHIEKLYAFLRRKI